MKRAVVGTVLNMNLVTVAKPAFDFFLFYPAGVNSNSWTVTMVPQ